MKIPRLSGLCGNANRPSQGPWGRGFCRQCQQPLQNHPCPHPHPCPCPISDTGRGPQPTSLPAGRRPGYSLTWHQGKGNAAGWGPGGTPTRGHPGMGVRRCPIPAGVPRARSKLRKSPATRPGEHGELLLQEMKLLINPQAEARKVKTPSIKGDNDL